MMWLQHDAGLYEQLNHTITEQSVLNVNLIYKIDER